MEFWKLNYFIFIFTIDDAHHNFIFLIPQLINMSHTISTKYIG
jgi:hypothetical protein